jgi:hypothetical protein
LEVATIILPGAFRSSTLRGMSRSLLARSLEPMVAILWGLFLLWSVWVAVVWIAPVGANSLGLVPGGSPPPYADLRKAVLLMANHADVAWLALGLMNVHLVVISTNGIRTARSWLATSAGGALLLGWVNASIGLPFGWCFFGGAMGTTFLGVAVGWVLLWGFLVLGARAAVLWARPRAGHSSAALLTGAVVLLTMLNVEWPARFVRGWWVWHSGATRAPVGVPWTNWLAWALMPTLMAMVMRERDVVSGVASRSVKPAVAIALFNAVALAARARVWLQG